MAEDEVLPQAEIPPESHEAATEALNGFRRILRLLRVASGETQSTVGLSAAQLFVLTQLAGADVLSINELAERTLTDRSSVAAVVDRLVERGLAARSRAADDRRRAAIHITGAGRKLLKSAPPPPTERLLAGLASLEPNELEQFAQLMSQVVDAMGLHNAPAPMFFERDQAGDDNGAASGAV